MQRGSTRWAVVGLVAVLASIPAMAEELESAMAEMMQAWQAYAAVGPAHEALHKRAGAWETTVKFWYAPDAEPQVSHGSSTVEPIMGGRYMIEHFSSTMPDGAEFQGMGLVAFDNMKEQFQAFWIDSMSTGFMFAESTAFDEDYARVEYRGSTPDPATGDYKEQRTLETWTDPDTRVMEAFETGPNGDEVKVMEIIYERE